MQNPKRWASFRQSKISPLILIVILVISIIAWYWAFARLDHPASLAPSPQASQPTTTQPSPTPSQPPKPSLTREAPSTITTTDPNLPSLPITLNKVATLGRGVVRNRALSPDGKLFAVSEMHGVRLFDAATRQEIAFYDIDSPYELTFSQDSSLLIVDGSLNHKDVLEAIEWRRGHRTILNSGRAFTGAKNFTFSPGNHMVAFLAYFCCDPYFTWQAAYDLDNGSPIIEYENDYQNADQGAFNQSAFSPDGRLLAVGRGYNAVQVWDMPKGKLKWTLSNHADSINSVAFSSDGRLLASGSADATVRLWDTTTGHEVRTMDGFVNDITEVRFSPDGTRLWITVQGAAPQVRDVLTGTTVNEQQPPAPEMTDPDWLLAELGYNDYTFHIAFSNDNLTFATASNYKITLWDRQTLKPRLVLNGPSGIYVDEIAYSPDGAFLVGGLSGYASNGLFNHNQVIVWDAASGNQLNSFQVAQLLGLVFLPDSHLVATGGEGQVEIWDVDSATRRQAISAQGKWIKPVGVSEDGKMLYVVDTTSRLFQAINLATGSTRFAYKLPPAEAFCRPDQYFVSHEWLVFSTAGKAETSCQVLLANVRDGALLHSLEGLKNETSLKNAAFNPDGQILTGSDGNNTYLWDTVSGQILTKIGNDLTSYPAISPDGSLLATVNGDGIIDLWDLRPLAGIAGQLKPLPTQTAAFVIPTPTATDAPQATRTSQPLPTLATNAISAANAAQVSQLSRVGRGTLARARWSADGNTILSGGSEGVDIRDGQTLKVIQHIDLDDPGAGPVKDVIYNIDGNPLAVGSLDNQAWLWDVLRDQRTTLPDGHGQVVFSPDGRYLTYQTSQKETLNVWNLSTVDVMNRLLGAQPSSLVFYPLRPLVANMRGNTARIWDGRTGQVISTLRLADTLQLLQQKYPDKEFGGFGDTPHYINEPSGSPETSMAFTPDGRFVAIVADNWAQIFDFATGRRIKAIELTDPEKKGYLPPSHIPWQTIAFSPSGHTLAVGKSNRLIYLVDIPSGAVRNILTGHAAAIIQVAFNPDGSRLLSLDGDGGLRLWDAVSGQALAGVYDSSAGFSGLQYQADDSLVAWNGSVLWRINPNPGQITRLVAPEKGAIYAVSQDGKKLAVNDHSTMQLWDTQTVRPLLDLPGQPELGFSPPINNTVLDFEEFNRGVFSRDGNLLVVSGSGGLWAWDTRSGQPVSQIRMNYGIPLDDLAISPDGQLVAAIGQYAFQFVEAKSGQVIFDFSDWRHTQYMNRPVIFHPNGSNVVNVGADGEQWLIQAWDIHNARTTPNASLPVPEKPTALAYNPDGSLLAVGTQTGEILILDPSTTQILTTLAAHNSPVDQLAFSPDGRQFASAGNDGTVTIWGLSK